MKKYFFAAALATATIFSACDPCKDVECQNSGTCVEGTCECATGYEGVNCETEMRAKFLSSAGGSQVYNATESCSVGTGGPAYQMTITPATAVDEIIISNYGALSCSSSGAPLSVKAKVTGNTFTVTGVEACSGVTATISGTGTFSSTGVSLSYKVVDAGVTAFDCTATMVKP